MKTKIFLILTLLSSIGNIYALSFNDGYVHDVNSVIDDYIHVQNDPFWDYPTTVNILDDGIVNNTITPYDDSILNIYGGTVLSIFGRDNSIIHFDSGLINGWISLYNNSQLFIDGGEIYVSQLSLKHFSELFIYSGSIAIGEYKLEIFDYSTATIYGSNFTINGRPVQNNIYKQGSGLLQGTLQSGDNISIEFRLDTVGSASLVLSPQMEPYCIEYPIMDFNRDCKVDLIDFAEFASQWMTCNLEPQSFCFQQ